MEKLGNNFYRLGTASNPVYLFGYKDEYTLVEGGLSVNSEIVLTQLKSILPSLNLLKKWIITHSHYDHCGLLPLLFPLLPEVTVYASKEAIEVFKDPSKSGKICEFNHAIESPVDGYFTSNSIRNGLAFERIEYVEIKDLDKVDAGGHNTLIVFATPGHSKCSISIYDSNEDRFFVSDALGEFQKDLWFPLVFDNLDDYIESINKIKNVSSSFIVPGHHSYLWGQDAISAPEKSLNDCYKLMEIVNKQLKLHYPEQLIAQNLVNLNNKVENNFIPQELYFISMLRMVKIFKTKLINEGVPA